MTVLLGNRLVAMLERGRQVVMNQFVQEALQMLHRRGELESVSSLRNLHLPISFFLSCIFIFLFTSNLITAIKAVFLSLRLSAEWSKVICSCDRSPCDSWHRSFTPVMPKFNKLMKMHGRMILNKFLLNFRLSEILPKFFFLNYWKFPDCFDA